MAGNPKSAGSVLKLTLALFTFSFLSACSSGGGGGSDAPVGKPVIKKVVRENYQSGKQFCLEYKEITKKEFPKVVNVPLDYSNPSEGSLEIYAYTMKPFDAKLPSYIYVDGGPGQNTHGLMPDFFENEYNEIRFDQRGLGCSAPDNFDIYKNSKIYSTQNTIQDMDLIRQAYGIEQWSVYGVSYGTVPATMYASRFPKSTNSIVLEGVLGRTSQMHEMAYKAEKMNIAIKGLNESQKKTFARLTNEESDEAAIVFELFFDSFYQDSGMRRMKSYLSKLILEDGSLNRGAFEKLKKWSIEKENRYPFPQQPGAVDENVLRIIQCKNLDFRNRYKSKLYFSESRFEFYTKTTKETYSEACDEVQVTSSDEIPYVLEQNPVSVPIYYFQGSHDGATLAKGAYTHWSVVAKNTAYFLMAQKGGHNPNLVRLSDSKKGLVIAETKLFKKAISASVISQDDVSGVNAHLEADRYWKLYTDVKAAKSPIEDDQQGILLTKNL